MFTYDPYSFLQTDSGSSLDLRLQMPDDHDGLNIIQRISKVARRNV